MTPSGTQKAGHGVLRHVSLLPACTYVSTPIVLRRALYKARCLYMSCYGSKSQVSTNGTAQAVCIFYVCCLLMPF